MNTDVLRSGTPQNPRSPRWYMTPLRVLQVEDTEDDAALQEVPTVVFNQAYFRTRPEAHVRGWVRHMLRQSRAIMPHFAGELSKDEIRHILAYLQSLP